MAINIFYSDTLQGGLRITGNTIGLTPDGSNGIRFLSTTVPGPPGGTSVYFLRGNYAEYVQGASEALLVLPQGSSVRSANLTWEAIYAAPELSVTLPDNIINGPITFIAPNGASNIIYPNTQQRISISAPSYPQSFYRNSTDVTNIVNQAQSGFYTVAAVPVLSYFADAYVAWTLIVAYENQNYPYRNLTIWNLFEHVQGLNSGFANVTIPISGFVTPSQGSVSGRILVGVNGGNPDLVGDFMEFGPSLNNLTKLQGPNNLINNFFAAQINNNDGYIDQTGTFGTHNSTPGNVPKLEDRNATDITSVDVSQQLVNSQTSAIIALGTQNDTYDVVTLGLEINVNAPMLSPVQKFVSQTFASLNDILTYTVTFKNTGIVNTDTGIFQDTLDPSLEYQQGSLTVNGSQIPTAVPININIGPLVIGVAYTVAFRAKVINIPTPNVIVNTAFVGFSWTPGPGAPPLNYGNISNEVSTTINNVSVVATKQVDKAFTDIEQPLTYSISIYNNSTVVINNIIFQDTLPNGTNLIIGTLRQDGVLVTIQNPNPPGVLLPNSINPGATSIVTFQVLIYTIPNPNPILNSATVYYQYNAGTGIVSLSTNTGIVSTQVNNANILTLKQVNKTKATCGDILIYTIYLQNNGNIVATNVFFKDTIPNGTAFIVNSVYKNGIQQPGTYPDQGITISTIAPNELVIITFNVQVTCS